MSQRTPDAITLDAVKGGDVTKLEAQLADFQYEAVESRIWRPEYPPEASTLICAAATAHQAESTRWLIDTRFPDWTPHLQSHLAAIGGGPAVYDVFISKWPHLINMDLGHNGNRIGLCIFGGDQVMVEYLLAKGVDPNTAHYSGRRFNQPQYFSTTFQNVPNEIMELLIVNGFTSPAGAQWPRKKTKKSQCTIV